ncbi:M4 family metallopeptidase [uncultured Cytophaga sp.]|uniref:M4 family metallopeptidase n=1 Tax=uncultured Cytophaga sp. TaxID=160238 RepID=UPI00262F960D|nr:M4 family metallopeptidase [uncultured Cytophaga sp.]
MKYFFLFFITNLIAYCPTYSQSNFDTKKHLTTTTNKAQLKSRVIRGQVQNTSSRFNGQTSIMQELNKNLFTPKVIGAKSDIRVIRSSKTKLPIFIQKKSTSTLQLRSSTANFMQSLVGNYLNEISSILDLTNASEQFTISKIEQDPLGGQIIRLKQMYQGTEIDGCESILHFNTNGEIISWNGSYIKPELIGKSTFPIQKTIALQTVLTALQKEHTVVEMSDEEKIFLDYSMPQIKSVFYIDEKITKTCVPAYIIEIRPNFIDWWEYVIDANTGNIISQHSKTCHIDGSRTSTGNDLNGKSQTINTYQKGSLYYTIDASRSMFNATQSKMPDNPVGAIQTLNLNNTWGKKTKFTSISSSNNIFDSKAISAHTVASKSYEYYLQVHNRNSIDGKGGTIISFINVADPDNGTAFDNAYWNGKAMYYGNGNTLFKPLAGGLDVGGHELTHGVIQNSANLNYQGESGAMNESFADIFGCSIDPEDWKIGEDIVLLSEFPSGALRDLSNPHNGGTNINSPSWQPNNVSEMYKGFSDNGGVHINSGITNYAFYLFATATQRSTAEKIFYRALTMYLTRSSQFIDLRIACIAAATDLYTASSNEVMQIGLAFDAVGIVEDSDNPVIITNNEYPINPGKESLLAYNTNPSLSKKLYKITGTNKSQSTINTTKSFSKPSITDDGSTAYYINTSNQIVQLFLNPGNTQEEIISDEQVWNSLAISKDGNRLAATTINNDTAIYVYDFNAEQWAAFILYSPTFTEGIKSGGPNYADALEWDHTGQYLIYDCYNEFENNSGDNISFWDINFIDVWNGNKNDFADGTITKLFPSLENGISVGNPTFSKNSSAVIAFDYIDEIESVIYVVGCNTEMNEIMPIVQSNELGFPSFNTFDSKIAYVYNTGFTESTSSIWLIDLDVDKISPAANGNDVLFVQKSKWPLFYASGYRYLPTSTTTSKKNDPSLVLYPNPTSGNELHIQFSSTQSSKGLITILNTVGQSIMTVPISITTGNNDIDITTPSDIAPGYYIVRIKTDSKNWVKKFLKI